MNMDRGRLWQGTRIAFFVGLGIGALGAIFADSAASSPNLVHAMARDVVSSTVGLPPGVGARSASEQKRDVSFANSTEVVAYPFHLDNSTDVVRLSLSVEVEHGLVRWELIDPSGAVRSRIGTTERASMDETELKGMKGDWLLRMNFQDATGRYEIRWVQ